MNKQSGSNLVYSSSWMKVYEDTMTDESGNKAIFNRIVVPDAAAVVPVFEDDSILMVENYRHGIGELLLELPGGFLNKNEMPNETARRELLEETGYSCSVLESKGWVYTWPGRTTQKTHVFSAKGLQLVDKDQASQENRLECMNVRNITRNRLLEEIRNGTMVKSGSTISALFLGYLT